MWERLTEGASAMVKFIAGVAMLVYLAIGAIYFVAPSVIGLNSCKENTFTTTSVLPTTWLFWPGGVYNTIDLARKLDIPVGTAWIERSCPSHAEALDTLQQAESDAQAGRDEHAARGYAKSTNLYPTPKGWYGFGLVAARQGNLQLAVTAFSNAIALDPYDVRFYLKRGDSYTVLGKLDQALADYNKLIAANPDYAPALNARGHVFALRGDNTRAIADYSKSIELIPRTTELLPALAITYVNRGVAYAAIGDDNWAIADFSKAIEVDPSYVPAYENRAKSYDRLGNKGGSIADIAKANALKASPRTSTRNSQGDR